MNAMYHSVSERMRKAATWALAAACLVVLGASQSAWPLHDALHEAIEEAGALLIGICIVGRLFCTLYISGRKNTLLVTAGPYSIVRNPLYLFSLMGMMGVGWTSGSFFLGAAFAAGYFVLLDAAVRGEERRLAEMFHGEYCAYLSSVPRWLPDFGGWRDAKNLSVDIGLVKRRFGEAAGLLLAMPIVETLEQLHEAGLLPAILVLP